MPRRTILIALSFLFLSASLTPAHDLFDDEVDKAKDFTKAGIYPPSHRAVAEKHQ